MDVRNEVMNLLSRVQRPPDNSSLHAIDDSILESFEERVGIRVPSALREWLLIANGAPVGPGGLFGIGTARKSLDIESYLNEYPEWVERQWLPIAGDGTGNYYVLAASRENARHPVLYIDTHDDASKPAYVVASDLWHFLRFLLAAELGESGWPFSRDRVVAEDPAIALVRGFPHPWDA